MKTQFRNFYLFIYLKTFNLIIPSLDTRIRLEQLIQRTIFYPNFGDYHQNYITYLLLTNMMININMHTSIYIHFAFLLKHFAQSDLYLVSFHGKIHFNNYTRTTVII